ERRFKSLAVRARADACLDEAGRIHDDFDGFPARRDRHAARGEGRAAIAGALGKSCKADAEKALLRAGIALPRAKCLQVDSAGRLLERLKIAALVEHQPGCRSVGKTADQIAPA